MALSINPLASLVAANATQIASSIQNSQMIPSGVGDMMSKLNLDANISRLSGGLNSGLNGLTAGVNSALTNASGAVSGIAGSATTAMGKVGAVASSIPGAGGAISTLQ